jgi:hypothetical protein
MTDYLKDLMENSPRILPVQEQENIHGKIIDFFKANPNPTDDQVHDFAESIRMDEHELERHIYMILTDYIENSIPKSQVGKHRDVPDETFDADQLAAGVKVEYEHTDVPEISKEIAKDHLAECKDYYTRLREMEAECEMESKAGLKESTEQTNVSADINPPESPGEAVRDKKSEEQCPCAAIKKASEEIKGVKEPE